MSQPHRPSGNRSQAILEACFHPQNRVSSNLLTLDELHHLHPFRPAWYTLPHPTKRVRGHVVRAPGNVPEHTLRNQTVNLNPRLVCVLASWPETRLRRAPMLQHPAVMGTQHAYPAPLYGHRAVTVRRPLSLRSEPEYTPPDVRLDPIASLDTLDVRH